jgi:hypothetical protein
LDSKRTLAPTSSSHNHPHHHQPWTQEVHENSCLLHTRPPRSTTYSPPPPFILPIRSTARHQRISYNFSSAVIMAAFMSQNHQLPTPALPHQSLPSNTPPEPRSYAPMNNPLQRTPSQHLANGSRGQQHRMSGEFRNRATVGVNGHSAMPVPTIPQSQLPNGQHRAATGVVGAAFDMPSSPPNSKSMLANLPQWILFFDD